MGIGRVQNDMQACIQLFLEAFSLFLVFSAQTKPNKMLHLNVIVANNNNNKISALTPYLHVSNLMYYFFILSFFFGINKMLLLLLKYTFLNYSNWFHHLCFFAVETVEVFEAIQHNLMSRAGWKFQSVMTHY